MPNGENALEIELMVQNGMTPMAAILAATREAARLTRILDRVGTLEPGKAADLIVVDGDPLDDIIAPAAQRPAGDAGRPRTTG